MKKITDDGEVIDEITQEPIAMAPPPFWKTPWNHDTDQVVRHTSLVCKDESRTQQAHAKDADINNILAKFLRTGELQTTGAPNYADIPETGDLQDNIVTKAQLDAAWEALPAVVRNTLKDPQRFLDYLKHCSDTGDYEDLQKLGLVNTPEPPKPADPPGAAPAPVPPAAASQAAITPPTGAQTAS